MLPKPQHIILFDGICNLCNSSVQFVIRHDKKEQLRFASLQSDAGQSLLHKGNFAKKKLDSFVLISDGQYFTRSTAALKVLKLLGGRWSALYVFIFVPAFIRNAVYNLISRNRYRLFGKREECMLPSLELKKRFLD